jgi:hypothetical protein
MNSHGKKMIAPVIIGILLFLYYAGVCILFLCVPVPPALKLLLGLIPLLLAGVSIYVMAERIKEIRSGEEDDLSQY